jgi:hypothetical protein
MHVRVNSCSHDRVLSISHNLSMCWLQLLSSSTVQASSQLNALECTCPLQSRMQPNPNYLMRLSVTATADRHAGAPG